MSEEKNIGAEAETADRKIYEIGFHIVPSVPVEKLGAEFFLLKEVVEKNGATIISEEIPKMRQLTYEMRKESAGKYQKFTTAYFGWIKFESFPDKSLEIDIAFRKNPLILRYILIKTVRENIITVPRILSYSRRGEAPKMKEQKGDKPVEKIKISEVELDKAIGEAIAE